MYNRPREAKRLFFDVIPRHVDDYLTFLEKYPGQDAKTRLGNPVWHIHAGAPPAPELCDEGAPAGRQSPFRLDARTSSPSRIPRSRCRWGFIRRYAPGASPATHPRLDRLVRHAVRYYHDFVDRAKVYRLPNEAERAGRCRSCRRARPLNGSTDAEALQAVVYEVGRRHFPDISGKSRSPDGRPASSQTWFATLYQILLGEERGPALRLLRRSLRRRRDPRPDRRRSPAPSREAPGRRGGRVCSRNRFRGQSLTRRCGERVCPCF